MTCSISLILFRPASFSIVALTGPGSSWSVTGFSCSFSRDLFSLAGDQASETNSNATPAASATNRYDLRLIFFLLYKSTAGAPGPTG